MKNKKIVFLHVGGHFAHREFARQITDNFVDINEESIPKDFDIYLIEAGYPKIVLMRMLGLINKKSKIISLFADPKLYFMKIGRYLDIEQQKVKKFSWIKKKISQFLLRRVDGGICVSNFEQELLKKFVPKIPSRVAYPFISDERYNTLIKNSPNLTSQKILFAGNNDYYYKGVDVLIDSFKNLKKLKPKAELYILGNIPSKKEWQIKGVYLEGRVDISDYLKKCSLYVHPSRGEAFGISVVESLLAGVPAMVSKTTGSGEIVASVDKNMLFELNSEEIAKKISDYFDSPVASKEILSRRGRQGTKEFKRKIRVSKFKSAFYDLLKEVA